MSWLTKLFNDTAMQDTRLLVNTFGTTYFKKETNLTKSILWFFFRFCLFQFCFSLDCAIVGHYWMNWEHRDVLLDSGRALPAGWLN